MVYLLYCMVLFHSQTRCHMKKSICYIMWHSSGSSLCAKYYSTQRAKKFVHTLCVRTCVKIMLFSCIFQKTLDAGRIGIAAQGLGIAQVKHHSKCFKGLYMSTPVYSMTKTIHQSYSLFWMENPSINNNTVSQLLLYF